MRKDTRTDQFLLTIKNNKFISIIIVISLILIGLGSLTNSLDSIISFVERRVVLTEKMNESEALNSITSELDFLFTEVQGPTGCDNSSWVKFRFENIGNTTFVYKLMRIYDPQSGENIYGGKKGFGNTNFSTQVCNNTYKATFYPGEVVFSSYYAKGYSKQWSKTGSYRYVLANVKMCTQPPPDLGECVVKRLQLGLFKD